MKNIKLIFLIIAIITNANAAVFSQSQDYNPKVEHISPEQGFSNDLIFCSYQDSKGFLWFGTMFGLVRYDGINYKTYRYDPLDSNTLSNDDIISIFEDRDSNMWFGTFNGGVNKYLRSANKFKRYVRDPGNPNSLSSNTVWDICQDNEGAMWFATEGGGLNKFDKDKFYVYKKDTTLSSGSISGNFIRSVNKDKDGNIWAGTFATGINKFDKGKNIFINYRNDPGDSNSLSNNFVTSVFKDSDGELWIGTGGGGLNKSVLSSGKFKNYKNISDDTVSSGSNFINLICEDSPGVLLIGTQRGLSKFYKATEKFEKIRIHQDEKSKSTNISGLIKDRSGVLWISSYNDGLYKLQFPAEKFKSAFNGMNVKCIYEDRSGRLWIGTGGNGMIMSDDKGVTFNSLKFNNEKDLTSRHGNKVNTIAEDQRGNVWAGTDIGLYKLDRTGNVIQKFMNDSGNKNSVISNNILKILPERSDIIWIGTDKGLDKFDPDNLSFTHYQYSANDSGSLNDNTILSIYEDKFNELWVGTYFGLNKLDRSTGMFRHFSKNPDDPKSIGNNYVFCFNEDNSNNFWIGTGGGLDIFDRSTETFFHFTERDGLPNDVITGLASDEEGYLWISTYKGISKFSVKDRVFRNYDTDDGLLSNMFNAGSYFKNSTGEILFGSIKGVNYFIPGEVKESKFIAPVLLTTLTKYDDKIKTETDISSVNQIELNYYNNFIKLGFTSVDYTNPSKNKFRYKLEGLDKEWKLSGNIGEAVYTNLDPGEYIFKVKGTNSDGVWNEKEASVRLIVTPPYWKTRWFYGILICLIFTAVILIQNYRIRSKVKYLIELEKIKEKERELMREQASRDYHDELGHKLTRISLYSRRINKKLRPTANGLTDDLNSIVETSNSLQSGAKDLIWAMNPQEDSLYDFTVRLRDFGNDLFENTGINFTSDGINIVFKDIQLSMNCKRHLIYIFKEGMNNILKYSRCTNVYLNFRIYGDDLEILLKDDGKGFDINTCQKGYGLKNIYSRAKQIGVNVNICAEVNTGSEIKLTAKIPYLILN